MDKSQIVQVRMYGNWWAKQDYQAAWKILMDSASIKTDPIKVYVSSLTDIIAQ